MYKTRLQQYCQSKAWKLPAYSVVKEGQDHCPQFAAVVTVNGKEFRTENNCRSSKQAQNEAAKLAFESLSLSVPPPFKPDIQPQLNPEQPPQHPQPQLNPEQPPQHPQPQPFVPVQPEQPSAFLQFPQPSLDISSFPQPSLPSPLGTFDAGTVMDNKLSSPERSQPKQEKEENESTKSGGSTKGKSNVSCNLDVKSTTSAAAQPIQLKLQGADHLADRRHFYKSQLQRFVQKRNIPQPVYTCERDGPPHALSFRCKVEIDGKVYEGPIFSTTLKDAEHEAAKVAVTSLGLDVAQEENPRFYKNLLQELSQRSGLGLPDYITMQYGEHHVPVFVSIVKLGGETFEGTPSRTKKDAEIIAAKIAYTTLKERTESTPTRKRGLSACDFGPESPNDVPTTSQDPAKAVTPSGNYDFAMNLVSKLAEGNRAPSSFKKIIVCPRQPNMIHPIGSRILPMSDNQWVAFSLPN